MHLPQITWLNACVVITQQFDICMGRQDQTMTRHGTFIAHANI